MKRGGSTHKSKANSKSSHKRKVQTTRSHKAPAKKKKAPIKNSVKKSSSRALKSGRHSRKHTVRRDKPLQKAKHPIVQDYKQPSVLQPLALFTAFALLLFIVVIISAPLTDNKPTGQLVSESPALRIDVLSTPLDPRSALIENTIIELSDRFRGRIDLHLAYTKSNKMDESKRRYCIGEIEPASLRHYSYCVNHDFSGFDKCFGEFVSAKEEVNDCAKQDISLPDADAIPSIVIGGIRYLGDLSEIGLSREICSRLYNPPPVCGIIPECMSDADCPGRSGTVAVCEEPGMISASCEYFESDALQLTIITSEECGCDTSRVVSVLTGIFGELDIRVLDIGSDVGRKLAEDHKIELLPAYLFPASDQANVKFDRIEEDLIPSGNYFILRDKASGSDFSIR